MLLEGVILHTEAYAFAEKIIIYAGMVSHAGVDFTYPKYAFWGCDVAHRSKILGMFFLFNFYAGMIAHAETLNRSILLEGMILHTGANDFKFQKFG